MDFQELKTEGYYIRKHSGTYKNQPHVSYEITKDIDQQNRTVKCYVNFAAARQLIKRFNFTVKRVKTTWLNHSESMDFSTQTKEPLKITFHS